MVLSIPVPERYPLVLLTSVGFGWLNVFQISNVIKHRKAARIPYPQMYAEQAVVENSLDAKKFNCAQRAHQNTLETIPMTLFFMLFSGLKYPTVAASLGLAFIGTRIIYTVGYSTGDPIKRRGFWGMLPPLLLQILSTWTAIEYVRDML